MKDILNKIGKIGLFPAITMEDEDLAIPSAKALIEGGLDVLEITMRTTQGIPAIRKIRQTCPEMLVGAGTVLSPDRAKEAVDAGAQFIVAPGFNPKLVQWCNDNNVAVIPGCVTPTEIEQALAYGINTLKYFPADIHGGINGCKALSGPYPMVKFIPMGGVDLKNLSEYAHKPYIHSIGGSWLCKTADVNAKNFDAITKIVKESINVLLGFELAHIGINMVSADASISLAEKFETGFGFAVNKGNSSNFADKYIEVNKSVGLGKMGHIALWTNSIERAVYYLEKRGFTVDWDTRKGPVERPLAVYLKEEFGGFAIHLLQK